jgi:hypothetical protein
VARAPRRGPLGTVGQPSLLLPPPCRAGDENYAAFDGRVWAAFGDLIGEARGVVVGHAGPIRVILRRAMGLPVGKLFDIDAPYGSLARVQADETGAPVLLWHRSPLDHGLLGGARVSHLPSGARVYSRTGGRRQAIRLSCIRSPASCSARFAASGRCSSMGWARGCAPRSS